MIGDLDKAVQLNPSFFLSYFSRGQMKVRLGHKIEDGDVAAAQQHYREAIDDYTETIRLCPDYAASYTSRGIAKSQLVLRQRYIDS